MTGIITLYGKTRFSLKCYDHLVAIIKPYEQLPSSSSMRIRVLPSLLKTVCVPSATIQCIAKKGPLGSVRLAKRKHGDVHSTAILTGSAKQAVVILPSSWAALDLSCLHILREWTCVSSCRCSSSPIVTNDIRIESSRRVLDKHLNSKRPFSLWINNNGIPMAAPIRTKLSIHLFATEQIPDAVNNLVQIPLERTSVFPKSNNKLRFSQLGAQFSCIF